MRHVARFGLSSKVSAALARKQVRANAKSSAGTLDVNAEWKQARKTKPVQEALAVLRRMMGPFERCMYCHHSHATDIEHFWPKAPYPGHMFEWPNFLLCCTECGRYKGDRFPLENGLPSLIDPTAEDPWLHLDFIPETGNLTARFDPRRNAFSRKGEATVSVLRLGEREALAREYVRSFSRLKKIVVDFLEDPASDVNQLVQDLRQHDDHGLLGWCFGDRGERVPPFADLKAQRLDAWERCLAEDRNGWYA
jgi:uncharacterized protein (TIGR02646 family)